MRVDVLEPAARKAIADLLAKPDVILREAERLAAASTADSDATALQRQLDEVRGQQRRLLERLITVDLPVDLVEAKTQELAQRAAHIEQELAQVTESAAAVFDLEAIKRDLPQIAAGLRERLLDPESDDLNLVLDALDVQIRASNERVEIEGTVPFQPELEVTTVQTSA